jgi:serine/threonine protein phosphatase 1
MRTFVLGDIHGAYKALKQCFQKAGFDHETDQLIFLGDVCDGWPEVYEATDELLKVKNLVYIIGNHDDWALTWAKTGYAPEIWLAQGGVATIESYSRNVPSDHIRLLSQAKEYYIDENKLFVHGGIKPFVELCRFTEVYVGHTPTTNYGSDMPVHACEIWLMDTGAGWHGKLSMMNIDTKEIFQSDPVPDLYPEHTGRSGII